MSYQLPTDYQTFIATSRYSRWRDDLGRRENWEETVDRYFDFFSQRLSKDGKLTEEVQKELAECREAVLNLEVMPSMRALMTAGKALERDEVAGFNCSYVAVDHPHVFDEIMYVLLNGTGVGFGVEAEDVAKLPEIPAELHNTDSVIVVADSKIGWATAYRELVSMLYAGKIPKWDVSKVRKAGERLKTFGGRACLTGDTIVYKDRKKSREENEITIKQLWDIQERERSGKFRGRMKKIKLRSLNEELGFFYRNQLLGVVDNGVCPVYEVKTKNGYRIKATGNHRFMDDQGEWLELSDFSIGDLIAVNGEKLSENCIDCGTAISRRAERCRPCCDASQICDNALSTTARQRKECRSAVKDYCEWCGNTEARFEVHHIDKNPHNNHYSNLVNLCPPCHQRHHAIENTYGDPYAHKYKSTDEIVSIEYVGDERVFDLQMQGPDHNFVANGFVSHNSGPAPLVSLFEFTVKVFTNAAGRKLKPIECHDIVCKVAEIVVVGGVRRSALISLSDLSDPEMRHCKSGSWWENNVQRALANNSAVYNTKPDLGQFMEEWISLYRSGSGERGIFNRYAAKKYVSELPDREYSHRFGTNPCAEIVLRSAQFCNLTSVQIASTDNIADLRRKVKIATILGTLQSSLTNLRYLRKIWKRNSEEERLLGVSLSGICDNEITSNAYSQHLKEILTGLREYAREVNKDWAAKVGINPSAAITCVKPEGTTSQLCDRASGIHPRYSRYYIRTVRADKKDPLAIMMKDAGFPVEDDVTKPNSTYVFSFPMKSPDSSVLRDDMSAVEQLDLWLIYKKYWAEHTISCTIYVREHEWIDVAAWVYKHFDHISGLSFLPHSNHVYKQAPYTECTKEEYEAALAKMPASIDWDALALYEKNDETTGAQEMACSAGSCDLV